MKRVKTISDSEAVLCEVMKPVYANHYGSVHGGTILRLVDEAAFAVATRHARRNVVLASMDHIVFKAPVNIGDILTVRASLCHVGDSSMDVEVIIETERLKEGKVIYVGSAYLTMVALNRRGRPTRVPRLTFTTRAEKIRSRKAVERRKERLSK